MGCIYKITNKVNGKIYIGQTIVSEPQRWQQHIWHANNNSDNDATILCRAIKKYGKENFKREIVEFCDNSLLNEREIYWINFYNSTNHTIGYNVSQGGSGHLKYTDDEILQSYLEYGSIAKASQFLGISRDQMSRRLKAQNINPTNIVPMCQYDLQGNFIKQYPTQVAAAKATNTPVNYIKGESIYNNYLWLRKDSNLTPKERLQQLTYITYQISSYDEFGNCIGHFKSASDAAKKTGIDVSSIKAAIRGDQFSAGGYLWIRTYGNVSIETVLNKYLLSKTCSKIEEMDTTGQVIQTFDSCNQAERFYGYGWNTIKAVCNGERKEVHGKVFRWANPLKRKLLGLE